MKTGNPFGYEAPKLNRVGQTRDVVLGMANTGADLDGLSITPDMEFAEESLLEE